MQRLKSSSFTNHLEQGVYARERKYQIIAACLVNISFVNKGFALGFASLAPQKINPLTTWMDYINGSSLVLGCILGAISSDLIGRKLSLILVNVPLCAAWLLFRFPVSWWQFYTALGLLYFVSGFLEPPVIAYLSESTQPRIRGWLCASSYLFLTAGILTQLICVNFLTLHTIALINCALPLASTLVLILIPESPYWLVETNRIHRARESLKWFIGKSNKLYVEEELKCVCKILGRNKELWISNPSFHKNEKPAIARASLSKLIFGRQFTNAVGGVAYLYFLQNFTGLAVLKTHHVAVFNSLEVPINGAFASINFETLQLMGCFICVGAIRCLGRRLLNLATVFILGVFNVAVAIYAFLIDANCHFKETNATIASPVADLHGSNAIPFFFLASVVLLVNCGLRTLPWVLTGEIFANRSKSLGAALAGIFSFAFERMSQAFFAAAIVAFTVTGMFAFYALMAFLGVLMLYYNLLETEGKTLHNIYHHYMKMDGLNKTISNENHRDDVDDDMWYIHLDVFDSERD